MSSADEERLTADMIELTREFGRYGSVLTLIWMVNLKILVNLNYYYATINSTKESSIRFASQSHSCLLTPYIYRRLLTKRRVVTD